jgi:type I restriction enzyme, R subunit
VSVKQRYAEEVDYKDYEKKVQKLIDTHVRSEGIEQITAPVDIFERDAFKSEVEKLETTASKADTIAHRTARTITEKMDEDPVFYRGFGKILQEAIDAYQTQRISEKEYLNTVTQVMESVVSRTGDKLPEILRDRDVAKAFYGVVAEVFDRLNPNGTASPEAAADVAVKIDDVIKEKLVVDWRTNPDVQNEMRNEMDDLLYSVKADGKIPLTTEDMDSIVERAIDIAKNRYPR